MFYMFRFYNLLLWASIVDLTEPNAKPSLVFVTDICWYTVCPSVVRRSWKKKIKFETGLKHALWSCTDSRQDLLKLWMSAAFHPLFPSSFPYVALSLLCSSSPLRLWAINSGLCGSSLSCGGVRKRKRWSWQLKKKKTLVPLGSLSFGIPECAISV